MPNWSEPIRRQLAGLNLAPTREAEIVEELAQHAADCYRELLSGGATEAEARRITLDEMGGHELLARELRAVERADAPAPVVLGAGSKGGPLAGLGRTFGTESGRCARTRASPPSRWWRWRSASGPIPPFSAW